MPGLEGDLEEWQTQEVSVTLGEAEIRVILNFKIYFHKTKNFKSVFYCFVHQLSDTTFTHYFGRLKQFLSLHIWYTILLSFGKVHPCIQWTSEILLVSCNYCSCNVLACLINKQKEFNVLEVEYSLDWLTWFGFVASTFYSVISFVVLFTSVCVHIS